MWIDEDGVAHTVAIPEPADLMSDDFRRDLDSLVAGRRSEVEHVLEAAQTGIFEQDLPAVVGLDGDIEFEGTPAPPELLIGELVTVHDLASALERTDLRWRLDAVLAIEDYID